jgi:hypothetical protein
MLNKRLLIKNIHSHNDECTFYDKKENIDLKTNEGKGKLLKHICALSNSNPLNESYLIIGVTNENEFVGIDFIDDSIIQDLALAYFDNGPKIKYENISFPSLKNEKSIGLLTISPETKKTVFSKAIDKIKKDSSYQRIGSKSVLAYDDIMRYEQNETIVRDTIRYSRNTLQNLLDSTFEFIRQGGAFYSPRYTVFKEQFVVCWSGYKGNDFYSEVDMQIINEGVRLFYSANTEVKIDVTENEFKIDEYVYLGFGRQSEYFPFESTTITFNDNGTYSINKRHIFEPPKYSKGEIEELYKKAKAAEKRILSNGLDDADWTITEGIAMDFFLCYINGISEAKNDFYKSQEYLDGAAAQWFNSCKRILEEHEKYKSA